MNCNQLKNNHVPTLQCLQREKCLGCWCQPDQDLYHEHILQKLCREMLLEKRIMKPFQCTYCTYSSNYKHDLTRHLKRHGIYENDVSQHQKLEKRIMKPFQCTYCNYSSNYNHNLTRHLKRHGIYENDVTQHQKLEKRNMKPFQCTYCTYSSKNNHFLVRHLLQTHGICVWWWCAKHIILIDIFFEFLNIYLIIKNILFVWERERENRREREKRRERAKEREREREKESKREVKERERER